MQAPKIDPRTYQDIVAETETLAHEFSGWQPQADGVPDAGQALIRIFGRFTDLIIQRLNRVPEKNFLAFLNLIGTEPLPPQPARVPLTFRLADNAPVDAVVPVGAQAAAPPAAGEEDEVIFETEQELLVTRSQIVAAYVYEPATDRYSDCMPQVQGQSDTPFTIFAGTQPVDHELYLACDPLLLDAAGRTVRINLYSPEQWQWERWPIQWAYWREDGWQPLTVTSQYVTAPGQWQVTINALPELIPHELNGTEAGWLRARLALSLPPTQPAVAPIAMGMGSNNNPVDFGKPFQPFGESYTYWYLDGAKLFANGGAMAQIDVTLAPTAGAANADLRLEWEYKTGATTWQLLGQSTPTNTALADTGANFQDDTRAFTRSGQVRFRIPLGWDLQDHRSRRGRWLRVKIAAGSYATMPTVADLTLSWYWELPRVRQITVTRGAEDGAASDGASAGRSFPELSFANSTPLDLGRDFAPFGNQPAYNDAFYMACDTALAQSGATVELALTLTNPVGSSGPVSAVKLDGKPSIIWEVFAGQMWQTLLTSPATASPLSLTTNGVIVLNLPTNIARTMVNGEERYWLRARLVGGNFGVAASYTGSAKDGYTLVPATFAPPLIKSISFTVTKAGTAVDNFGGVTPSTLPVTACVTRNGGVMVDEKPVAASVDEATFLPYAPLNVSEPALYLGLDQPFAPRPFTLYVQVEPPRAEDVAADMLQAPEVAAPAHILWEYSSGDGWAPLGALDETATLTQRGLVHFVGPRDFTAQDAVAYHDGAQPGAAQKHYWLRLRWQSGDFVFPPQARRVLLNTTWASQAATRRDEILGSSNGDPGQRFTALFAPVLPDERLDVRESELPPANELAAIGGRDALTVMLDASGEPDEIWVRWQAVSDLYGSGPRDRHYVIDRLSGEIRFGNGRQGLVPTPGQNNLRLTYYRSGGGTHGNRATGEVVELKSSVPYIESVSNLEPATGGAQQEGLERVKERGCASLRHRNRAVTAQDLEDLAYAAAPNIARVAAIMPTFDPYQLWLDPESPAGGAPDHAAVHAGESGLVIVPDGREARPTPGLHLIERVRRFVQERSSATADLWVAGPEWVAVSVNVSVAPTSLALADVVIANVQNALNYYLHPLTGGVQGYGWPFGVIPRRSDLFAMLETVDGVDHVRRLEVTLAPITAHGDQDELRTWLLRTQTQSTALTDVERGWQSWVSRSLVFAGEHTVRVALESL